MAHNQRIRPPGMWTSNSALLAAEVERFDEAQYLDLHEGGGTWAILSNVVIGAVGNASWSFTAPVIVNDISGHVVSGKSFSVDAGATLDLSGTQKIEPGAALYVLGAAQNPGTIWVEQNGKLIVTTNGYFGLYGAGTGDIFGTLNVQQGGVLDVQVGGAIKVEGGGLIKMLGSAQTTAKIVLANDSELDIQDGATIQAVGGSIVLTSQGASWTKLVSNPGVAAFFAGQTYITDQASGGNNGTLFVGGLLGSGAGHIQVAGGGDLTVAYGGVTNFNTQGVLNFNDQSVLNFNAGCTVNFLGTANLKGSPVFLHALLLGAAAKAIFYDGSTFADGSVRTFSAPQIPFGPNAVNGVARPIFGPIPSQGQTTVQFDPSGLSVVNTPQSLSQAIVWLLNSPSHPEVARFLYIRQLDQTQQGSEVDVYFGGSRLVHFAANNNAAVTSAALLLWDTNTWTVVFVVGPNVAQN